MNISLQAGPYAVQFFSYYSYHVKQYTVFLDKNDEFNNFKMSYHSFFDTGDVLNDTMLSEFNYGFSSRNITNNDNRGFENYESTFCRTKK